MSFFDKPNSNGDLIAHAVCGAYLMVAHADGRFDDVEQAWLHDKLLKDDAVEGVSGPAMARAATAVGKAFSEDYAAAAEQILEMMRYITRNTDAVEAVVMAARLAVVADKAISQQETLVLEQISDALGLEQGTL